MKKKFKLPSRNTILGLLLGVALGILLVIQMEHFVPAGADDLQALGAIWLMLLAMYLAIFLHIPMHEAGHLIFGLATGYRFVSFRIFGLQLTLADGKIKLGFRSVAGTGGQCLMAPPEMLDDKLPFLLYNLGGSIMNLLAGAVFLLFFLFGKKTGVFSFFCIAMAELGLFFALANGIPMITGGIPNDGSNARSAAKNPAARKALWLQLTINKEISDGKRLKDLPDDWFVLPHEKDMDNPLVQATAAFVCSRLIDQGCYAEAAACIERLLSGEQKITGIYANLLRCDLLCCELVGENRSEVVGKLYTDELCRFMKSMKTSPSIARTEYIYALMAEKDQKKTAAALEKFEKTAKIHPYPSDLLADRELMAFALQKAQSEVTNHG